MVIWCHYHAGCLLTDFPDGEEKDLFFFLDNIFILLLIGDTRDWLDEDLSPVTSFLLKIDSTQRDRDWFFI